MSERMFSLEQYSPLEIKGGKTFNMSVTIQNQERQLYAELLTEFEDVFAKSHKDLKGIPIEIAEHRIDLLEGGVLV